MKSEPSPPLRRHFVTPKVAQVPMTLGEAAAAHVRFIIWCLPFEEPHGFAGCHHQVEPVTVLLRAAEGDGTKCRAAEMGSPAKIDYRKNFFETVVFSRRLLEFVFAASDLIDAG